jgi:enoyl-CoA hydratase/carnithine racemase
MDPEVRAILVTGAGKSFCPGLDSEDLASIVATGHESRPRDRLPQSLPTTIPKPIVAAINGGCAGIGLVQALMCDVRFAAKRARFSTAFSRRGLQAEHGIASLLPRIVGFGDATDLLLSGRVFDSTEAARIGLVKDVVEDETLVRVATEYARELATLCSPTAMAAIKHQLYAPWREELELARRQAINLFDGEFLGHPDFAEGVASFVNKRSPRFASWVGIGWGTKREATGDL